MANGVSAPAQNVSVKALENAVAGDHRSEKNKSRDQYRHPVETLKFFGFTPNMTVVEITPGGGWYTEILASCSKRIQVNFTVRIIQIQVKITTTVILVKNLKKN